MDLIFCKFCVNCPVNPIDLFWLLFDAIQANLGADLKKNVSIVQMYTQLAFHKRLDVFVENGQCMKPSMTNHDYKNCHTTKENEVEDSLKSRH